jgi:hypothetical protein
MNESSSVCITSRRSLFSRRPTFLFNGKPRDLRIQTKGVGLTVSDANGLLCSGDGGPTVNTRQGRLSVSYPKDTGVRRSLELGQKKWLWRQNAQAGDVSLSRYFSELHRWGGLKDRIFHCIENAEPPEERYLLSQRRHSLAPDLALESVGTALDLNFMIALMVFFWIEVEEERRPY